MAVDADLGELHPHQVLTESIFFLPADFRFNVDRVLVVLEQYSEGDIHTLREGELVVDPHAGDREVQGEDTKLLFGFTQNHFHHQDTFQSERPSFVLGRVAAQERKKFLARLGGEFDESETQNVHAANQFLGPHLFDLHLERLVKMQSQGELFAVGEVEVGMDSHPAFAQVVNVDETVLAPVGHIEFGREDLLDFYLAADPSSALVLGVFCLRQWIAHVQVRVSAGDDSVPGQRSCGPIPEHLRMRWVERDMRNWVMLFLALFLVASLPALAWEDINKPDKRVDIQKHLREGRKSIVFFYSRSDKTANRIQVELADFDQKDDEWDIYRVRLKRLNSPVARQHGIKNVPAFILYDEHGQEMARGRAAFSTVLEMLEAR